MQKHNALMNGTQNTLLDELENKSIFAWLLKHKIKNEGGEPLDFDKYRFLRQIYADNSPFLVCMKAAQIGFSTYEILKTAYECRNDGIDIIYVLPSDDDVNRFSGGKTNKIIMQNPVLQQWTKDKDSTYQKQFGSHTIYYEGAWTERAALSTTAKKLVVDEFDRCKPEVVEQYDSRLQSTANPRKAFFSNPSLPNTGVSKYYALSDQKKWHITHSCGAVSVMDEGCINYELEIFQCPVCKGEITDEERRMGQWVATSEGVWSGYWIPLWIAPWMSAKHISDFKKDKSPEYFANFVAGLPYIGGDDSISPETVLKNVVPTVNSQQDRVIIGVDTGLPIYYVLMNAEGVFHFNRCKAPAIDYDPYAELEGFLLHWPKSILVSDQGGDLIGIRQLQAKYPGRVFLCYYRKDRKTKGMIEWGENKEYGKVLVDRNKMLQLMVEHLRSPGRLVLNGTVEEWRPFANHFGNLYREQIEVMGGQGKDDRTLYGSEYIWKRNGPDHWVHAFLYALVGFDKFNGTPTLGYEPDYLAQLKTGRIFTE